MKVIEIEIDFEDFHYVSGILELKVSGTRISDGLSEVFDVNDVLSVKFNAKEKFLSPNIPEGIAKDRVFALSLPKETPVYLPEDSSKGYSVHFDKIICDDRYVSENGYLKVDRKNTTKDGLKVFSTIVLEAYGLMKKTRTEVEKVTFYELFDKAVGPGKILIEPKKEFYEIGEKVKIKAIPDKDAHFYGWDGDFNELSSDEVDIEVEKDYKFSANFIKTDKKAYVTNVVKDVAKDISSRDFWDSLLSPQSSTSYSSGGYSNRKVNYSKGFWGSLGDGISALFMIIGYLFYAAIFFFFIAALIQTLGWSLLYIIGVIFIIWLISFISRRIQLFSLFGYILNVLFIFFIGFGLFSMLSNFSFDSSEYKRTEPKPETIEREKDNSTTDYVHHVRWKDFKNNHYETYLKVNSDFVLYEQQIKETLPRIRTENDYNLILKRLYQESEEALYHVVHALDSVKSSNKINQKDFPQVVVSMVQSIPYYAILDMSCNPYDYRDETMRDLLLNNPCQGYVKFGLKSPSEFLKDIKGDCDTRTLFLFCILKHYGFDVAIFGSEVYKHSLLGIVMNVNSPNALYKEYKGKKYYLWETTSKNFNIGQIPQEISEVQYWNINLN
ncbi:hypothetical protein [Gaetbulibacter sp. NE]|uniref:hypothetical protein n=1 Tax=Gaetbulibacter sp. NE TaxID=2982307 RepID=UPI0021CF0C8D|nr:hypothetical protein [Gaetbulibacter sp. NE]